MWGGKGGVTKLAAGMLSTGSSQACFLSLSPSNRGRRTGENRRGKASVHRGVKAAFVATVACSTPAADVHIQDSFVRGCKEEETAETLAHILLSF